MRTMAVADFLNVDPIAITSQQLNHGAQPKIANVLGELDVLVPLSI